MPRILRLRPHPPEESIAVRVAVLATVLFAVAAVAVQEPFVSQGAVAAVAITVGSWVSYRYRHGRNWWLKTTIAILVLVVARDFFQGLVASPDDPRQPLVQLFLWLQALHSFDLPARKDLKYSLASAVVLMAVAAVYARDLAFGLLLVPFALAGATAVVTMAAGEKFALTSPAVFPTPRYGALLSIGLRLGVGVVLAAAVAFSALPHGGGLRVRWLPVSPKFALSTRLHARIVNPAYPDVFGKDPEQAPPVFNPQGYVGFSTYVDLRLRGVLSDTLVMRVRATRPAFWRGLAFDAYTGRGWKMSDRSVEEYSSDQPSIVPRFGPDEPWPTGSEQVIQTFYIEATQPNVIFGAYRPFEVYFPTGSLGVDQYAGLRSPVRLEQGTIYSVISRVPAPTATLLRRDGDIPDDIQRRYLQLPRLPARVRELASQLTAGWDSPYDKAIAINRFLARSYAYNLQAPPLADGADAVDEFLFVSRQGSCETFASAMAVLLRAAGVPARLVTGYATGSYNVFTGYYEVRNSDAHAWVEAYLPAVGWIEFEPTPGFATPEDLASRPLGQWLARDVTVWALQTVEHAARPVLASLQHLRIAWAGGVDSSSGTLAVLVLALALIRRRRSGPATKEPADGICALYDKMVRGLQQIGVARDPAATPREFAACMPGQIQPLAFTITEVFEEHRYSLRRITAEREAQARQALAALLRTLAHVSGKPAR